MAKYKRAVTLLLVLVLAFGTLAGCSRGRNEENGPENNDSQDAAEPVVFFPSDGIDDNGYWTGVSALDHVELFDVQAMSIPSEEYGVDDASLQSEISAILENFYTQQQVMDRAVEDGDTVNIDYVGSVDGVEFEGGTTGGMGTDVTIGVTSYIDDFLEQLVGHTPGETVRVEVTFPESYGVDDLNGKDAVFITEINYIVETVAPELNDEFVAENLQEYYGWATVEEMNQSITDNLQKSAIQEYVQEYLMENTMFSSTPDEVLSYMEQSMVSYYQDMAVNYGVEVEELLEMYGEASSVDELIEQNRDNNVQQANYYLAMQAVAEDAQITASETDVAAFFSENMGIDDYSQYEAQYGMPYLKQVALHNLVLNYLEDRVVME